MNNVGVRDNQLDIYRGISMLYVVCFIHVIFWYNIGKEPFLSIALIEMPAIFFISGASLSIRNNKKTLLETFLNRFKRVILPYYIYAFVSLLILALLTLFGRDVISYIGSNVDLNFGYEFFFDITSYSMNDIIYVLFCRSIPQSPFSSHLWFILPYMIISCSFVFQSYITKKTNRWYYAVFCIILCVVTQLITNMSIIREIVFYNVFFMSGYLFYKRIGKKEIAILGLIFLLLIVAYVVFVESFTPMQRHKFPPDLLFLCYGLFFLCFISLILGNFKLPKLWIFQLWNSRGYTIYLYQNFIYFLVYIFLLTFIKKIQCEFVQCIICSVVIFLISTLLSFLTYRIERYVIARLGT